MLANGVKETTATTGTGLTVSLSAVSGYLRFSDVLAVGEFCEYAMKSGANWEWGIGRVAASNTLERSIVTAKVESGVYSAYPATALSLAGTSDVACTALSSTVGPSRGGNVRGTLTPGLVSSAHLVNTSDFGTTTGSAPTDKITWIPFVWPSGCRRYIASLKLYVHATGSATKGRIAILKPLGDSLASIDILTQTADISLTTTGVKTHTFSTPVPVPEARFMMALMLDGACTLRAADGVIGDPYNNLNESMLYHRPQVWNAETDAGWTSITTAQLRRNWMDTGDNAKSIQIWIGQ